MRERNLGSENGNADDVTIYLKRVIDCNQTTQRQSFTLTHDERPDGTKADEI